MDASSSGCNDCKTEVTLPVPARTRLRSLESGRLSPGTCPADLVGYDSSTQQARCSAALRPLVPAGKRNRTASATLPFLDTPHSGNGTPNGGRVLGARLATEEEEGALVNFMTVWARPAADSRPWLEQGDLRDFLVGAERGRAPGHGVMQLHARIQRSIESWFAGEEANTCPLSGAVSKLDAAPPTNKELPVPASESSPTTYES
jgi:hypothetical protein